MSASDSANQMSLRVRPDVWRRVAEARLRDDPMIVVLLAVKPSGVSEVVARAIALGAEVLDRHDRWGWLLLRVPCDVVEELACVPAIDGLEIDFVGSPPLVLPPAAARMEDESSEEVSHPFRDPHLAVHDLAGVGFLDDHPTFDGRGVTLAMNDAELPDLLAYGFQVARDLDGRIATKAAAARSTVSPHGQAPSGWAEMTSQVFVTTNDGAFSVDGLRWIAPRRGSFQFGLVQPTGRERLAAVSEDDLLPPTIGVLWDEVTDEVWVDHVGAHDFSRVPAMREFHVDGDVGVFGDPGAVGDGSRRSVAFVVQLDRRHRMVRIVLGTGSHATATLGHAIGSGIAGRRLDGVAPGARLVAIESGAVGHDILRAMAVAVDDPLVDVVVCQPNHNLPPLFGVILDRIVASADKLVFSGAGNTPWLGGVIDVSTDGSVITVGAYQSRNNYRKTLNVDILDDDTVHFASAFGPSPNGRLQPDVLAPSHLVSSDVGWAPGPHRPGVFTLPYGATIASGTSTAGPIAGAVAALLISAAKQAGVDHAPNRLRHALLSTARFLDGIKAYQQGRGLLQVGPAWDLLRSLPADWTPTRIEVAAPVVTAEARRTGRAIGLGIFEREGWRPGQVGTRMITLTRRSGPTGDPAFELTWLGDTHVFSGPAKVILPLDEPVDIPVRIALGDEPDVYSAIVQVHENDGMGIACSVGCTVVAALALEPGAEVAETWEIARPSLTSLFLDAPLEASAVRVQLRAGQPHTLFCSLLPPIPPLGQAPEGMERSLIVAAGGPVDRLLRVVEPGAHGLTCQSVGFQFFPNEVDGPPLSPTKVDVAVSFAGIRLGAGTVEVDPDRPGVRRVLVDVANLGVPLAATLRARLGELVTNRLPTESGREARLDVEVPEGAATLAVGVTGSDVPVSLYLYAPDRHPFDAPVTWGVNGRPAVVDDPAAGRWQIAAVARAEQSLGHVDVWQFVADAEFGTVGLDPPVLSLAQGEQATVEATIQAPARPDTRMAMLLEVFAAGSDDPDHVALAAGATRIGLASILVD